MEYGALLRPGPPIKVISTGFTSTRVSIVCNFIKEIIAGKCPQFYSAQLIISFQDHESKEPKFLVDLY